MSIDRRFSRCVSRPCFWRAVFILLCTIAAPVAVMGQASSDPIEIVAAERLYVRGEFDVALRLLDEFLEDRGRPARERIIGYRLAALVHIATDQWYEARHDVTRILEIDDTYTPDAQNDPPPYVELVNETRSELAPEVGLTGVGKAYLALIALAVLYSIGLALE